MRMQEQDHCSVHTTSFISRPAPDLWLVPMLCMLQENGGTLVRNPGFEEAVLAGAGGALSKKSTVVVLDA
jgi:hypothetical protein